MKCRVHVGMTTVVTRSYDFSDPIGNQSIGSLFHKIAILQKAEQNFLFTNEMPKNFG